jgi:hypothetical protein
VDIEGWADALVDLHGRAYGHAKHLQDWLAAREVFHVLAVKVNDTVTVPDGDERPGQRRDRGAAGARVVSAIGGQGRPR